MIDYQNFNDKNKKNSKEFHTHVMNIPPKIPPIDHPSTVQPYRCITLAPSILHHYPRPKANSKAAPSPPKATQPK